VLITDYVAGFTVGNTTNNGILECSSGIIYFEDR
jgi:hypothetical protein